MCPVRCSSSAPRRAFWLVAAALFLVGCKVNADVKIEAGRDGTGEVAAVVLLDEAAADAVGPLDEHLRVDDLRTAGWTVIVGDSRVTATKAYDHPDEASQLLQEVGGALLTRARVARSVGFAKTTTEIDVELDLTKGLAGFSDAALDEQLGGLPGGFDPNNLDLSLTAQAHGEEAVTVDVPVGEKAAVATAASSWHVTRLIAAIAAPLLALAALIIFLRRRTIPVPVTGDP